MGKKEKGMTPRGRWIELVLYPESQQESIDYVKNKWPCAWILHDKDVKEDGSVKKVHVHLLCRFPNPRYISGVAKEAGCPEQQVEVKDSPGGAYTYLNHEGHPDKYQYPAEDIHHENGFDPGEIPGGTGGLSEEEQVEALFRMPLHGSAKARARWAYDNGCWAAYRRSYGIWRDIAQEEQERLAAMRTGERVAAVGFTGCGQGVMYTQPDISTENAGAVDKRRIDKRR